MMEGVERGRLFVCFGVQGFILLRIDRVVVWVVLFCCI